MAAILHRSIEFWPTRDERRTGSVNKNNNNKDTYIDSKKNNMFESTVFLPPGITKKYDISKSILQDFKGLPVVSSSQTVSAEHFAWVSLS